MDSDRRNRIAAIIRRAADARGLSTEQLAAAVGRRPTTIRDWKAGRSIPSLVELGPLCAALGLDANVFVDLPEDPIERYRR